jgi:co-chaperonin GroES (HSP10)
MIQARNDNIDIDFDQSKSLGVDVETGSLMSFEAGSVEMPEGYFPINDRILVQMVVEDRIGNLHVPRAAAQAERGDGRLGRVLHIGSKVTLGIVPNDLLAFDLMGGRQFDLDGKDVFLLEESEVLGLIQC